MKYYCENCGSVLDEDNLAEYSEGRPGAYGAPCSEIFYVCPCCGNIPGEYNYQDKTCADCINLGREVYCMKCKRIKNGYKDLFVDAAPVQAKPPVVSKM